MADTKMPAEPEHPVGPTDEPTDTEGHFMSPSGSYELTKARSKDIERQAREHQRQKEVRNKGK